MWLFSHKAPFLNKLPPKFVTLKVTTVTSHLWNKTCFEKWWKSRAVLVWLWSTLLITYGRFWPARCLWWTCKYRYPRPKAWTNVSLSLSAWFSTLLTHMVAYPAEFINPTAWSSKVCREARSSAPSNSSTLTNRKLDFAAAINLACSCTFATTTTTSCGL